MSGHLLVYDADCGACSKFKSGVDWLDKYNLLRFISLKDADEHGLLNSIPRSQRYKSFHLISPGDKVSSGANAIPILLALLPIGSIAAPLILLFPPSQRILNLVYSTLSRLHDTGSCSYKSSDPRSSLTDRAILLTAQKSKTDEIADHPNIGLSLAGKSII